MIDLKHLFDAYNICARFTPGFLFVFTLFLFEGKQNTFFQQDSVFFVVLIIMLSSISGFLSASLIKILEQFIWNNCGNPTIRYFKKKAPEVYEQIYQEYGEAGVIPHIKSKTRGDVKLLWKNISYGFFRNSILLALIALPFSHTSKYFCINIQVAVVVIVMTAICSRYYAQQALESYREKNINPSS